MNNNTLRFGVFRALAFGGFLVAGAWAGEVAAITPALSAQDLGTVESAARDDLMAKAAAVKRR